MAVSKLGLRSVCEEEVVAVAKPLVDDEREYMATGAMR